MLKVKCSVSLYCPFGTNKILLAKLSLARLNAAVSSVTPSPTAPKSLTDTIPFKEFLDTNVAAASVLVTIPLPPGTAISSAFDAAISARLAASSAFLALPVLAICLLSMSDLIVSALDTKSLICFLFDSACAAYAFVLSASTWVFSNVSALWIRAVFAVTNLSSTV